MACVIKIKTTELKNFGDYCENFFEYIFTIAHGTDRLDLVFDSYAEKSVKDSERRRRRTVMAIKLHNVANDTPVKYLMDFGSATCSMDNVFSTIIKRGILSTGPEKQHQMHNVESTTKSHVLSQQINIPRQTAAHKPRNKWKHSQSVLCYE